MGLFTQLSILQFTYASKYNRLHCTGNDIFTVQMKVDFILGFIKPYSNFPLYFKHNNNQRCWNYLSTQVGIDLFLQ